MNPLKWVVQIFGHTVRSNNLLSSKDEIEQWISENIKFSKYTVLIQINRDWRKYFQRIDVYKYKFLFKIDAMAFKLRWL